MTGFWSQGNTWRVGILSPISCNHRALMKDTALYQLLCRVPFISVWGGEKNLFISSSEDMRAGLIRYYNGTLTQICGFSWEEVQSHLAWRMPLHVAHIPPAHWLSQSRALAWHGIWWGLTPRPPNFSTAFCFFCIQTLFPAARGHRFLLQIFAGSTFSNMMMIYCFSLFYMIVNEIYLRFGLLVGQNHSIFKH